MPKIFTLILISIPIISTSEWISAETRTSPTTTTQSVKSPYFPLKTGNTWTYKCVEAGDYKYTKSVEITSESTINGIAHYVSETKYSNKKEKSLDTFIINDDGAAYKYQQGKLDNKIVLISANPQLEQKIGERTVKVKFKDFRKGKDREAVELRNLDLNDRKLTDAQASKYHIEVFAKGLGLVAEEWGLNGISCTLTDFNIK
jgi:hypothetical protein